MSLQVPLAITLAFATKRITRKDILNGVGVGLGGSKGLALGWGCSKGLGMKVFERVRDADLHFPADTQ